METPGPREEGMSELSSLLSKKGKSDEKSQIQLTKCLNEKRRREQENTYIEELAELISASVTDMSSFSVKPDKCAILQETVNQIKQIKNESETSDAVQQSQVSSSKPSIVPLATERIGPLILEALDGFVFLVNCQGIVEHVSEKISLYLKYTQEELIGKSIYNIIHVGDHAQFSSKLLPMSYGNSSVWPSDNAVGKGKTFFCRMLIKPSGDDSGDDAQVEHMQISTAVQPCIGEKFSDSQEESERQSCLLCIARRDKMHDKSNTNMKKFTTKLDLQGKIIACDTSQISGNHNKYTDLIGRRLQDLCHSNDVPNVNQHLQDVLQNGQYKSNVFRFKLQDNHYVNTQTTSHPFTNPVSKEIECITSTHIILRESDNENELKSLGNALKNSSQYQQFQQQDQSSSGMMPPAPAPYPGETGSGVNINPDGMDMHVGSNPNSRIGWEMFNSHAQPSMDNNMSNMNYGSPSVSLIAMGGFNIGNNAPNNWNNVSAPRSTQNSEMIKENMILASLVGGEPASSMNKHLPSPGNFQQQQQAAFDGVRNPNFAARVPGVGANRHRNLVPHMGGPRPLNAPAYSQRSPSSQMPQGRNPTLYQYQRKNNLPAVSPGAMTSQQSTWNHPAEYPPMTTAVPHCATQTNTFNSQAQNRMRPDANFLNIKTEAQCIGDKKPNQRPPKLCQLLTQNTSTPDQSPAAKTENSRGDELCLGENNKTSVKSPGGSIDQSPQPGPGQSPQEKPQSTSGNDEMDHSGGANCASGPNDPKRPDMILKKLLSRDEDEMNKRHEEDMRSPNADSAMEVDKNEAEPKKSTNNDELLKQLLSDDHQATSEVGKVDNNNHKDLLQKLLQEDEEEEMKATVPAQSTSQDQDGTRHRHVSGPQFPTTTHTGLPESTSSVPHRTSFDDSMLKPSEPIKSPGNMQGFADFNTLFTYWDKDNSDKIKNEGRPKSIKRKASFDGDSNDMLDSEPTTSTDPPSKVLQRNVLLAQLLSRKTSREIVVNTQITANPTALPAPRTPKDKLLPLKTLDKKSNNDVSSTEGEKECSAGPNLHEPPRSSSEGNFHNNSVDSGKAMSTESNVYANKQVFTSVATSYSCVTASSTSDQFNSTAGKPQMARQIPSNPVSNNKSNGESNSKKDSKDALLAHILQQAVDLQNDLDNGQLNATPGIPGMPTGGVVNSMSQPVRTGSSDLNQDDTILSQLEHVFTDTSNLQFMELESTLYNTANQAGNNSNLDLQEKKAIEAIQKQLMSLEPMAGFADNQASAVSNKPNVPMPTAPLAANQLASAQVQVQLPSYSHEAAGMTQQGLAMQEIQNYSHLAHQQSLALAAAQQQSQQQPPPPFSQAVSPYGQASPQLTQGPPQALRGASLPTQGPRPMPGATMNLPARQAMSDQQQKLRMRKRQRLQDEHFMTAKQQQQHSFTQMLARFPQTRMDSSTVQPFPENLAELMKSGNAPNVTLQRNQSLPEPMSPRYSSMQQRPQQSVSPMIGPVSSPSQLSPHFTQSTSNQWNARTSQTATALQGSLERGMHPGNPQFASVPRHRTISGNSLSSPMQQAGNHFHFPPDSQFSASQAQMSVYNSQSQQQQQQQQQQQMYAQNRIIHRQLSSLPPGRGSPRTPHSPFSNSPDAMLMSPHAVSPNSGLRPPPTQQQSATSQVSPTYNSNYPSAQAMAGATAPPPPPAYTQPTSTQSSVPVDNLPDFDMQLLDHANLQGGTDSLKSASGGELGTAMANTSSKSQYVKQEIRNFCNARSEKQSQQQQQQQQQADLPPPPPPPPPPHSRQAAVSNQAQLTTQQQTHENDLNDLLQIIKNDMPQSSAPQQQPISQTPQQQSQYIKEEIPHQTMQLCARFRASVGPNEDSNKVNALFRTQLMSGGNSNSRGGSQSPVKPGVPPPHSPNLVNVIHGEHRPCEDRKADVKGGSLLEQLLSDKSEQK